MPYLLLPPTLSFTDRNVMAAGRVFRIFSPFAATGQAAEGLIAGGMPGPGPLRRCPVSAIFKSVLRRTRMISASTHRQPEGGETPPHPPPSRSSDSQ